MWALLTPGAPAARAQGMSVTPADGHSADDQQLVGSMGEHLQRRMHESRSLFPQMLGGSPQLHQAGFSPQYNGARAGAAQHITPLTLS